MAILVSGLALVLPPLGSERAEAATPAVSIALEESSPNSRINASITLTATVTFDGSGAAENPGFDWYVEFSGTGDGGWSSGPIETDGGEATYERASAIIQTETITAAIVTPGCDDPTSASVIHDWWRPEITIEQVDERTVVGQDFVLDATLTHGGRPVPGVDLELTATEPFTEGDFDPITSQTNSTGVATFGWSSDEVSTELITVSELIPTGVALARTSHNWVAAISDENMSLVVEPTRVRTGGPLTATATLTNPDGPVANAPVQFFGTPPDAWNTVDTDSNGQATFPYTAGPLGFVAASAEDVGIVTTHFESWTPTLTWTAPDSTSIDDSTYTATATLSRDGLPIADASVEFTIQGDEAPATAATTDAGGRAGFPVDGSDPLTIVVTEAGAPGTPAMAETTHRWIASPPDLGVGIALDQARDSSRVGRSIDLTAAVTIDGEASLEGWDVVFASPALDGEDRSTTDARGVATGRLASGQALDAPIIATATIDGCGTVDSGPVFHEWWLPVLDITPKNTTSPARRAVDFTATLTRVVNDSEDERTDPVQGESIVFTMRSQSCPLPVRVAQATTDDNGTASVPFTRDGPSIDSVIATEAGVVAPVSAITTHNWGRPDPPPVSITLTQSLATSRAGTDVAVTAVVHDSGRPGGRAAAGVPVRFLGLPAGTDSAVTNGNGEASATFTGVGTAPTLITATTAFGCGLVVSPTITHEWFVPALELTPPEATTDTGTTAEVKAALTHGTAGVGGQEIELTIDSSVPGEPTLTRQETTHSDGTATFHWGRNRAGVDALTARETVLVQPQQATATHTWKVPAPVTPPPSTPPPVTPPPAVTPRPVVEPTSPSPEPSESPTTSPSPTPTPTPSPTPSPTPTDLPSTSTLVDGPEVGRPGGDIQVAGNGCRAGQTVTVRLGSSKLGITRAAADGTFYLRTAVPELPLGRYVINSSCGTTIGDKNVDITAPQVDRGRAGIAAAGMTTASTFIFFVLLIKGVISFLPRRRG